MKTFTTFAGAQRAAGGDPILRVLSDPDEVWVVLPSLSADVMIYTRDSERGAHQHRGSLKALDIAVSQEN